MSNLINKYCHKKNTKLYGCFVDFSKAFDSLPRDILFKKLVDIGITGKFYQIIQAIYKDDKICIKLGENISSPIQTFMGVRQGCVLSPLLFNIFMSDLPNKLSGDACVSLDSDTKLNCLLWADDIILLSETEDGLKSLLDD